MTTLAHVPGLVSDNDRSIGTELDIYVPSLQLAVELNGIFHYEPIFGDKKLSQIQNNDANKFQMCQQRGISLCIIDVSKLKYMKENLIRPFFDIIISLVDDKMVIPVEGIEPSLNRI